MLIELTNDGYLGNTRRYLRQHLASAVFRAVETNRPVLLRVTNVGVTGLIIDGTGENCSMRREFTKRLFADLAGSRPSDGSVKLVYARSYGDWFAWLCSIVAV